MYSPCSFKDNPTTVAEQINLSEGLTPFCSVKILLLCPWKDKDELTSAVVHAGWSHGAPLVVFSHFCNHSCHWNHMNIKCVWADFLSGGGAATARCLRRHVNICTCDTTGCFSGHYSSVICNEMDILGHFMPYLCHKSGYFWENLETFPAEVMATKTRYFCQDVGKFPAVFVATEPGVFNVTSGRLQQFFVEIFLRKCWNIYSLIWH